MTSYPTTHWTRRHFLLSQALSLGPVAFAWLLDQTGGRAEPAQPELERPTYDLKPKTPPAQPRARAMISLFMQGGPSHLDLFDPKPELAKRNGTRHAGQLQIDNDGERSSQLGFGTGASNDSSMPIGMLRRTWI